MGAGRAAALSRFRGRAGAAAAPGGGAGGGGAGDNAVPARPYARKPEADELGPFPEVTGGLSGLLAQAQQCYAPRITGEGTIAGRPALVLDLGRSRCAAGGQPVEWTIWVDQETF